LLGIWSDDFQICPATESKQGVVGPLVEVPASAACTNTKAFVDVCNGGLQFWSGVDDMVDQHLVSEL
jgi:hypothetical protein